MGISGAKKGSPHRRTIQQTRTRINQRVVGHNDEGRTRDASVLFALSSVRIPSCQRIIVDIIDSPSKRQLLNYNSPTQCTVRCILRQTLTRLGIMINCRGKVLLENYQNHQRRRACVICLPALSISLMRSYGCCSGRVQTQYAELVYGVRFVGTWGQTRLSSQPPASSIQRRQDIHTRIPGRGVRGAKDTASQFVVGLSERVSIQGAFIYSYLQPTYSTPNTCSIFSAPHTWDHVSGLFNTLITSSRAPTHGRARRECLFAYVTQVGLIRSEDTGALYLRTGYSRRWSVQWTSLYVFVFGAPRMNALQY